MQNVEKNQDDSCVTTYIVALALARVATMGLQLGFIYCTIQDNSRILHTLVYLPIPCKEPRGLRKVTFCTSRPYKRGLNANKRGFVNHKAYMGRQATFPLTIKRHSKRRPDFIDSHSRPKREQTIVAKDI